MKVVEDVPFIEGLDKWLDYKLDDDAKDENQIYIGGNL